MPASTSGEIVIFADPDVRELGQYKDSANFLTMDGGNGTRPEKVQSRLSKSTDDLEETETLETKRGGDGEAEMQRLSRTMKKKSQSSESLEDILDDAGPLGSQSQGQGQPAAGVSASSLPSKVETRETQSAETFDENLEWKAGKETTPGSRSKDSDGRTPGENLSGTLHYSTAEKETSEIASQDVDSVSKERVETASSGKLEYEVNEDVHECRNRSADGRDSTSRLTSQSESVNMESKDTQDSTSQQESTSDDWRHESACHEETAKSSSQQHEKADLSLTVGDAKSHPVASLEVDASEESERFVRQESEKLEKDGQKLEATSSKETERDESYEKIGMAAKTDKGEIIEESGVHRISNAKKMKDETTQETCSDGVLKRSSSMELLESENTENTTSDRQTVVEKDDSGKTRQSSSMKSSTQKESHKRAMHQESSHSVQASGSPDKIPRFDKKKRTFEPKLGSWGNIRDRERVFDPRLGKYVTKPRPPDEAEKIGADYKEGDKESQCQQTNTESDKTVCTDNSRVCSEGLSTGSTTNASYGFTEASSNIDQDSAMSEMSTDHDGDVSSEAMSVSEAQAPIGTIDELDDYDDDDDWGSDSGFDTLSTVSQGMKSTLTDASDCDWHQSAGETEDSDIHSSTQTANPITTRSSYPQNAKHADSRSGTESGSVQMQQRDTVGDHQMMRDDGSGSNPESERGSSSSSSSYQGACTERQDMIGDGASDKPGGEAMGIPVPTTKHVDELCAARAASSVSSGTEHVQQAAKANISELSPSVLFPASGLCRPAKFVSTSQRLVSSTDGRGPSAKDGISITGSDEAKEYTGQIHSSGPSQQSSEQVRGHRSSGAVFSDPAQVCGLSESFGVKHGAGNVGEECVKADHTKGAEKKKGKRWEAVDSGSRNCEKVEQSGSTWDYREGRARGEPNKDPAAKLDRNTAEKEAGSEIQSEALSSADIFAQNMDDIKDTKDGKAEMDSDGDSDLDVSAERTTESHAEGTSQSIEVTDTTAAGGMPASSVAMDTMSQASQHLEQIHRGEPAGVSSDTHQHMLPVVPLASMESADNSPLVEEEDFESESSGSSETDQSFDVSFEDTDSEDIMQEMNDMELAAEQGHSSAADSGENETDISDQGLVSQQADIAMKSVPGTQSLTNSSRDTTDVLGPASKKLKTSTFTSPEGLAESNVADQEVVVTSETPTVTLRADGDRVARDKTLDSELDVTALEKDAELNSDKENVPDRDHDSEVLTSDKDNTNLSEDKFSDQNVVRAMKTLTQVCADV